MKHASRLWCIAACVALPAAATAHPPRPDWDAWYGGDVQLDLRIAGGSGAVVQAGETARLSFQVDSDAYVAVYAIDPQGWVRLLFPRFWSADGFVPAGERVRLDGRSVAYPIADCGVEGIVYVQAVASPVPFDWRGIGLVAGDGRCDWWRDGSPLRVQGDPLDGFNDVNRLLFPDWDKAAFATHAAWYCVGHAGSHPAYLCGVCAGRYRGYHGPWTQVRAELAWDWQRGGRYCRPVYRPLYVYQNDRRVLRHAEAHFEPRPSPGNRSPVPGERRRREVGVDAGRHQRDAAEYGAPSVDGPRRGATSREGDRDLDDGARRVATPAAESVDRPRARRFEMPRVAIARRGADGLTDAERARRRDRRTER